MQSWITDAKNSILDKVQDAYDGAKDILTIDEQQRLQAQARQRQKQKFKQQERRLNKLQHQGRIEGHKAQFQLKTREQQAQLQLKELQRKGLEQIQKQALQRRMQQKKADVQWQLQKKLQSKAPTFYRGAKIAAKQAGSALYQTAGDVGNFAGQTLKSGYMGALDTISGLAKTGSAINNVGQGTGNIMKGNIWQGVKQLGQGAWQGTTGGFQVGAGLVQGAAAIGALGLGAALLKRGRQNQTYKQYKQHIKNGGSKADFALRKLQNTGQNIASNALKGAKIAKFGLKHGINAVANPNKLSVALSLARDLRKKQPSKVNKKQTGGLKNAFKNLISAKQKTQQISPSFAETQLLQAQASDKLQKQDAQNYDQNQNQNQMGEDQQKTVIKNKKIHKGRPAGRMILVQDKTAKPRHLKAIQHKQNIESERMIQQFNKT